jgi:AcrR family transcriptional regulator
VRAHAVADVQVSAIAARAGVAPSQVLYYFGSRNDALVAAFAHAEQALSIGRSERLGSIDDCTKRLAAYVSAYLPEDRHDPVWKLWIEGWLRSESRAQFAPSGADADKGWVGDLVACLEHASACGGVLPEPAPGYARRLIFLLDGLAVHVLADHIDPHEALGHAMTILRADIRGLD